MKKIYLLIVCMMLSIGARAQFNGSGTGTSDDPYIILNADQFYSIRNFQSSYAHFSILCDIDLSDYAYGSGWEPIPTFNGTIDGNGHKITGLYINKGTTNYVGLFAKTSKATLKNFTVEGNVTGNNYVGGIVGSTISCSTHTEYENVHFHGTVIGNNYIGGIVGCDKPQEGWNTTYPGLEYYCCGFSGTITGADYVGGIVGYGESKITNSSAIATVIANQYVGGIAGDIHGTTSSIEDCYASVNISTTAGFVGGIAGNGLGSDVKRCAAIGKVVALGDKVGGIIGYAHCYSAVNDDFYITDSYFSGYLKANDYVGGIVGYNGGAVWKNSANGKYYGYVIVQKNYAKGRIVGHDKVGGILSGYTFTNNPSLESNVCMCSSIESETVNVGRIQAREGATPKNCYSIYTTKVMVGGITISDEEIQNRIKLHGTDIGEKNLKTASFYQGLSWDFGSVWGIINTECIPYLQTQAAPPIIQSSLTSGETTISGNSFDGGIVKIFVDDSEYSAITKDNIWSITVPTLKAGEKIVANANAINLFPSYDMERYVSYLGNGTQTDPYLIKTASDLKNIHGAGYFKLANDIDLADLLSNESPIDGWQPLGVYSDGISYFDGDNHTISNLFISREEDFVGLFGSLTNATIKNLTIKVATGKKVIGKNNVGILAGRLNNCTIENINIVGETNGQVNIGGLAGQINGGFIKNISVAETSLVGKNYIGGIAGTSSALTNLCKFSGNITDDVEENDGVKSGTTVYVGGLFAKSEGAISESFTEGEIVSTRMGSKSGGIVGENFAPITNCYSTATTSGDLYAAGIAAENHSSISQCYACGDILTTNESNQAFSCGLVGYNDGENSSISNNSVMNKHITTTSDEGNVFRVIGGTKNSAPIPGQTNYAMQNMILSINGLRLSQTDDPFNGYMKPDASFKSQSLYENNGWDFANVWKILEGQSYPTLKRLEVEPVVPSNILINSISLSKTVLTLEVDKTETIKATILPDNATSKNLIWTSTNEGVAIVENGIITAVSIGNAIIIATSTDGSNISAICNVSVIAKSDEPDADPDVPTSDFMPSTDLTSIPNTLYFNDVENKIGDFNLELNMKCAEENITAFQCDVYLPEGVEWKYTVDKRGKVVYDQPTFNEDRTDESYHSISPIALNADGSYRMIVYSMANEIILETDGAILTLPLSISDEMEAGDYNLIIKGIVVTDVNKQQTLVDKVVSRLTIPSYTLGDVNGDDMINVTDVVSVIAYILGDHSSDFIFPAGDINEDGVINVTDVVSIIDIILNSHAGSAAAAKLMAVRKTLASGDTSNLEIIPFAIAEGTSSSTVKLNLNNPGDEFTAFQCDIQLPEGIDWENTVDKRGNVKYTTPVFDSEADRTDANYHTVSVQKTDGIFRVIVYSMANETILDEEGAVLDIPFVYADDIASGVYDVSIKNVVLTRVNKTDVKPADYTFSVLVGSPTESAIALNGNFTDEAINEYNTALADNTTVAAIDLSDAVNVSSNTAFATGNKNLVLYVAEDADVKNTNNVVVGDECANLVLTDGYNFAAPVEFTAASASYEREMTTTWGTIVLPFDVASNENVVYYLPTEVDGGTLLLTRQEILPANTPALVENVSGSGIAVSATNVDVSDDLQPSVNNSITMYGSYANGVRVDNPSAYYIYNDKFWLCNEYFYANAFRGYFALAGTAPKTLSVIVGDGVTTGVDGVNTNNVDGYYDLSGKRFGSLQKGVNIVKTKTGESYKVIVE